MTEDRLQNIVIEMVALGNRDRAIQYMHNEVDRQLHWWHLTSNDGILLRVEITHRYEHYEKFFDKPDQSGT